jgi:hypothetical protein
MAPLKQKLIILAHRAFLDRLIRRPGPPIIVKPWPLRLLEAAMETASHGYSEHDISGRRWIAKNIILPVWGSKVADKFVLDRRSHQYCGDTADYLYRLTGKKRAGGMSSPGKVRYNWAVRDGNGTVYARKADVFLDLPRIGDIVLHQNAESTWHGHVMVCLGCANGQVLVCEGNHSQSRYGVAHSIEEAWEVAANGEKTEGFGYRIIPIDKPDEDGIGGYYITAFVRPKAEVFA